jgi:hypothetical protein
MLLRVHESPDSRSDHGTRRGSSHRITVSMSFTLANWERPQVTTLNRRRDSGGHVDERGPRTRQRVNNNGDFVERARRPELHTVQCVCTTISRGKKALRMAASFSPPPQRELTKFLDGAAHELRYRLPALSSSLIQSPSRSTVLSTPKSSRGSMFESEASPLETQSPPVLQVCQCERPTANKIDVCTASK